MKKILTLIILAMGASAALAEDSAQQQLNNMAGSASGISVSPTPVSEPIESKAIRAVKNQCLSGGALDIAECFYREMKEKSTLGGIGSCRKIKHSSGVDVYGFDVLTLFGNDRVAYTVTPKWFGGSDGMLNSCEGERSACLDAIKSQKDAGPKICIAGTNNGGTYALTDNTVLEEAAQVSNEPAKPVTAAVPVPTTVVTPAPTANSSDPSENRKNAERAAAELGISPYADEAIIAILNGEADYMVLMDLFKMSGGNIIEARKQAVLIKKAGLREQFQIVKNDILLYPYKSFDNDLRIMNALKEGLITAEDFNNIAGLVGIDTLSVASAVKDGSVNEQDFRTIHKVFGDNEAYFSHAVFDTQFLLDLAKKAKNGNLNLAVLVRGALTYSKWGNFLAREVSAYYNFHYHPEHVVKLGEAVATGELDINTVDKMLTILENRPTYLTGGIFNWRRVHVCYPPTVAPYFLALDLKRRPDLFPEFERMVKSEDYKGFDDKWKALVYGSQM